MPLLRWPHDHRRDLQARRRTPRPAITPSRGQVRDAMTAVLTSSHQPPAAGCRLRCRSPVAPWPANDARRRPPHRNRLVENSGGNAPPAAIADPPPTPSLSASLAHAAPPSNRHRRPPPAPLTAGSFPGGFRTPALSTGG